MTFEFNEQNTFCISLQRHEERWLKMQRRFIHLRVTRWIASERAEDVFHSSLTHGQKGCAQSHVNLWRHAVQKNLPYVFILEDDACFDKDWKHKLAKFCPPDEWDAIFLNASEPIPVSHTWVKVTDQYLTGGYILSQPGAKQLLAMFGGEFYSSDWMTSRLQLRGKCYSYFPWLIIQEGADSTIDGNVEADHAKVLSCLKAINYPLQNYEINE